MLTPTHALISCGLLARKHSPARNWAVFAGAVLPDMPMAALFVWDRNVLGLSEQDIFDKQYWTDTWQIPTAIGHSIPLALIILALGMIVRWNVLSFFALSMLLHIAGDLPFHNDDAHMHLWPLSRWKYISPVSYWDPAHYGNIMHWVELGLMIAMMAVLWLRFDAIWVRVAAGLGILAAIGVPIYFTVMHGLG